ncbi:MAG: transcriptional regulator [Bifidobacteriaceae bacterium]|nr:transcriptional regulator [Bifidobacteriaceae bacterium]
MTKAVFDEEIHSPVRLRVCSMLGAAESVDFATLSTALGVADSVLSKHLSRLEEAGYVTVAKLPAAGHIRTWVGLTKSGRRALAEHLAELRQIADDAGM